MSSKLFTLTLFLAACSACSVGESLVSAEVGLVPEVEDTVLVADSDQAGSQDQTDASEPTARGILGTPAPVESPNNFGVLKKK